MFGLCLVPGTASGIMFVTTRCSHASTLPQSSVVWEWKQKCLLSDHTRYNCPEFFTSKAMNQFVARIVNHFVNEVLIEGLAKSRTFQRFAVLTDAAIKDVHKASSEKLKTTFEEFAGQQMNGSSNMAGGGSVTGPPLKPLAGFSGFVAAFVKEVRKDLGMGR
jgi:hypothetical protein